MVATLLIEELEVALACSANGTEPVVWNVGELRSWRDAAIRVAFGGLVDEPARDADVPLTGH